MWRSALDIAVTYNNNNFEMCVSVFTVCNTLLFVILDKISNNKNMEIIWDNSCEILLCVNKVLPSKTVVSHAFPLKIQFVMMLNCTN